MPSPEIVTEYRDFGIGVQKLAFVVDARTFWTELEAQEYIRSLNPKHKPSVPAAKPVERQPGTVKALVVHSPYAQEIASGEKPIEYRSWKCTYRGWLAIVAARRREGGADAGRCVCLVKLVDITGCEGDFKWHLESPMPITERIEIPGKLGIYDCAQYLPANLLKRIEPARAPERKPAEPEPKKLSPRNEFLDWERFVR